MATQTVEQVQRLAPYLESLEKRVLDTAFGTFSGGQQTAPGLLDKPINLPQYQVAGLDPLQQQAAQLGQAQVGTYQPALQQGLGAAQAGIGALGQGVAMLDPSQGISQFMNPYQSAVIDEINRQAAMGAQKVKSGAYGAGAFGGSREGVQLAEGERARLGKVGEFLSKGFDTAVQSSQRAGQLLGGIGQAFGGVGAQTADIGRVGSELGRADVGSLSQLGQIGQQQSQAQLDATRQNLMQQAQEPFTRLELGSSLLKGTPSGSLSSVFKSTTTPQANPFLQGVGAYTALSGAGATAK
jgi:hypothetical protein